MMRRSIATIAVVLGSAFAGAPAALAQTPASSSASGTSGIPAGCTYASCALRVERSFLNTHFVRGAAGERVGGNLGGFGGGMEPLLAGPDSAAAYARSYTRNMRTGATLGLLGIAAFVVAAVQSDGFQESDPDALAVGASIASVGFAIASIPFTLRAQRDLSRGVWWYNAALPR